MTPIRIEARHGRVGVVGDTHSSGILPAWLLAGLGGVDVILHAGDITEVAALGPLEALAPVVWVKGNGDRLEGPTSRLLEIGGALICLMHGHVGEGRTARERARRVTGADVVVYGHSHTAEIRREDGVLLVNPGSPSGRLGRPPSGALLQIAQQRSVTAVLFGPGGRM